MLAAQSRREVQVDLDGEDRFRARCQTRGENSGARPDFDEAIIRPRRDCFDDFVSPARRQEVLTETLARPMRHAFSIDSPRQNFSSISSISSSLRPK